MTGASRPADLRPGYLVVHSDEAGTYVGGLMVTDDSGLPLDFRYTDPITPTRLQRALYGGALDRYLRADVVASTLLGAITERPTVLIVDDERLLEAVAADCPVASVITTSVPPLGARGETRAEGSGGMLVQAVESRSPLRVDVTDQAVMAQMVAFLVTLSERMDPLEPADRVRAALALIAAGEAA